MILSGCYHENNVRTFLPLDEVLMQKKKSNLILIKHSGLIVHLQLMQRKEEDVKLPQMKSAKSKLWKTLHHK